MLSILSRTATRVAANGHIFATTISELQTNCHACTCPVESTRHCLQYDNGIVWCKAYIPIRFDPVSSSSPQCFRIPRLHHTTSLPLILVLWLSSVPCLLRTRTYASTDHRSHLRRACLVAWSIDVWLHVPRPCACNMNITSTKIYNGNIQVDVVLPLSDPNVCHIGVAGTPHSTYIIFSYTHVYKCNGLCTSRSWKPLFWGMKTSCKENSMMQLNVMRKPIFVFNSLQPHCQGNIQALKCESTTYIKKTTCVISACPALHFICVCWCVSLTSKSSFHSWADKQMFEIWLWCLKETLTLTMAVGIIFL